MQNYQQQKKSTQMNIIELYSQGRGVFQQNTNICFSTYQVPEISTTASTAH